MKKKKPTCVCHQAIDTEPTECPEHGPQFNKPKKGCNSNGPIETAADKFVADIEEAADRGDSTGDAGVVEKVREVLCDTRIRCPICDQTFQSKGADDSTIDAIRPFLRTQPRCSREAVREILRALFSSWGLADVAISRLEQAGVRFGEGE